jgi:two-component system, NtrC family, response regulator AtoC
MKLKVFVVDDDRYYARLLSYRLEKPEFEVSVFNNGESLLANLEEPPDLILLDIMMPGMNGIEVLKQVKEQYPNLPVLVVSAQGVMGTAAEAIKTGAYDYVTKGQDDLLRLDVVVKNVRERKALTQEVERLRSELEKIRQAQ